jgi:hypothetical protein
MPDNLHDSTFIFELLKLILLNDLSFNLLDGHCRVLPTSSVNDPVAAFRDLSVKEKIIIVYLIVGFECLGSPVSS